MTGEVGSAATQSALDLLVVGALTIDHFADGSLAPGGSVLHATRAAVDAGYGTAVMTVAGTEEAARSGLDELASIAAVDVRQVDTTLAFRHEETATGRRLWLEAPAARLVRVPLATPSRAVLLAPVADELDGDAGPMEVGGAVRGAILQGWLRELANGEVVRPRPLASLDDALVARLATHDVLVASREDLLADGEHPGAQLDRLRARVGAHPTLVVTDAAYGAWVDTGDVRVLVEAARVVRDVPMVGAGDAFAALLLGAMGRGRDPVAAARDAAGGVAEMLAARSDRRIVVIGDLHGMDRTFVELIRGARLIDATGRWIGGRDELWCLGDLVDRGLGGSVIVSTLRRLSAEAAAAGGHVGTVIGNHEILMLAARAMPDEPTNGPFATFREDWLANGGVPSELARVTDADAAWMATRPAMARVGDALLLHADAGMYLALGRTLGEANERMASLLAEADPVTWDGLLGVMTERYSFRDDPRLAARMLARFGGRRIVHGHTPVARFLGVDPATVRAPHVYADGRAMAMDPGLPLGGPGFVHVMGGSPS